ncbi:hypothetical protein Thivi_2583 [Thiocystis violascens DSM 198]|uniref:Uncharacterized protein n=2 Tax=Thiocystis violascens TaxID=73141 RepID=I3YBZ9_THIV6|nr:hypothetical protein Thivi_2583 [Thiocystis violascens DSM 198]
MFQAGFFYGLPGMDPIGIFRSANTVTGSINPMFWIPKTLYEALPYALLLFGGLAMLQASNPLMFGSGCLLAIVGAIIWRMRQTYRKRDRDEERL